MSDFRNRTGLAALFLIATLSSGGVAEAQNPRLAEAGFGAVVGAAVGTYMDRQQERFSRIPGAAVRRMGEDTLLVRFDSDVLFDAGSSALGAGGRSALDQMADVINDYRKTAVVVQGHADAMGDSERSQDLSGPRADAVRRYLVNRGVEPERVTAVGLGATAPVAADDTEPGRRKNRRLEILLKARSGPSRQGF